MALSPINPTQLTPPRVALIDERSGAISREWYRFFLSLLTATQNNQAETELAPDTSSLLASYDAMLADLAQTTETQPDCCVSGQAVLTTDIQGLSLTPTAAAIAALAVAQSDIQSLALAPPGNSGSVTSVNASGGTTGMTFSGGPITSSGTLTLGGTLAIANGGTNGSATPIAGGVAYGTGAAYGFSAVGTSGQVLTSAGAGAPTWSTPTTGTVTSVTGTAPVVSSGGSTPAISMAAATASVNGYLTSTDWTTFNSKGSGTVTSVSGVGTVNGITLTGTVTSSGNLTLGGTLSGVSLTTQVSGTLPVANGGTGVTSSTGTVAVVLSNTPTLVTPILGAATATSVANGLGAVGTPSYTFAGDLNTGMWSPAADTVAVSTAGSERMRLNSAGNLLVGTTTTPSTSNARIVAGGTADAGIQLTSSNGGGALFLSVNGVAGAAFYTHTGAVGSEAYTERMRLNASGNLGIGTTAPVYQLQLSTDSAAKPTSSLWTIASDSRVKIETGEYTKGLDAVCALRPITYQYNGAASFVADGKENISIIAQEAMQHFPECVGTFEALLNEGDEEKTELYNWNGHALTFALVNAVKELKTANDALTARVAQLEGK